MPFTKGMPLPDLARICRWSLAMLVEALNKLLQSWASELDYFLKVLNSMSLDAWPEPRACKAGLGPLRASWVRTNPKALLIALASRRFSNQCNRYADI